MKILHIAPTPFFADRGCHIRILGEIRALQAVGHDIVLATYHIGRDIEGIPIRRIARLPWYKKLEAGASWQKLYLDFLLLITSLRVCIQEKPDIIHGHLHEGALISKLVSLFLSFRKIPVLFDVQGSLTGELESYGFFKNSKILKKFFYWIERRICRMPDYFVCSSISSCQFMKEIMMVPEHKLQLVPDGIYPDFFNIQYNRRLKEDLGIHKCSKIVLYSGSLLRSKGIDFLLQAIPKVVAQYKTVCFLIIGYPIAYFKEKAADLKIENYVRLIGNVDFFKLPDYLYISDIGVDPKIDGAGEGSGKIVNYMGAGLSVVCFDTTNNRKLLDDHGFYSKVGDHNDFADKIIEALTNEEKAKISGQKNKIKAKENFSWQIGGKNLSEVYIRLAKLYPY